MNWRMSTVVRGDRAALRLPMSCCVAAPMVALVGLTILAVGSTASATSPKAVVSLVTGAPVGPIPSGQIIDVKVAPNTMLKPDRTLSIEECSAPLRRWMPLRDQCDPRTRQADQFHARRNGAASYAGYLLFALPDRFTLDESRRHRPICDLTHPCVLVVGWGFAESGQDEDGDDAGNYVASLPFYVSPTPGDTGGDPGTGTPEVPYVLALPVLAGGILGGMVLVRRRRSRVAPPE
jgi:hypothetical protein